MSRLIRGELDEETCAPDLRAILGLCEDLRRTSGGAFDIRRHRADGRPDPTGLVKGWAIEEASLVLDAAGAADYTINAGGDIVARGEPEPGRAWRVGIRHPRLADRVAAVLAVRDLAVATSGGYERGDHIVDPRTGRPPRDLLSFTVVGPSLTYADAYATIGFVLGLDGPAWVHGHPGYGAYAITADERVVWTPGRRPPPGLNPAEPGHGAAAAPQASGSTLPGLRIPSGSRASLIARIIATAPAPRWSSR